MRSSATPRPLVEHASGHTHCAYLAPSIPRLSESTPKQPTSPTRLCPDKVSSCAPVQMRKAHAALSTERRGAPDAHGKRNARPTSLHCPHQPFIDSHCRTASYYPQRPHQPSHFRIGSHSLSYDPSLSGTPSPSQSVPYEMLSSSLSYCAHHDIGPSTGAFSGTDLLQCSRHTIVFFLAWSIDRGKTSGAFSLRVSSALFIAAARLLHGRTACSSLTIKSFLACSTDRGLTSRAFSLWVSSAFFAPARLFLQLA
mmetsp:Transcript_6032/g.15789  ORF Transcript_6032/g.15789 Transcript_6032/m.15789 type:complete len:254 (-) Transcript_6032:770-1531(-)